MSAYANDPRVTAYGNAGFDIAVTIPSGGSLNGRVRRAGEGWESYWADGAPMRKLHDTADEGIRLFIGEPW